MNTRLRMNTRLLTDEELHEIMVDTFKQGRNPLQHAQAIAKAQDRKTLDAVLQAVDAILVANGYGVGDAYSLKLAVRARLGEVKG